MSVSTNFVLEWPIDRSWGDLQPEFFFLKLAIEIKKDLLNIICLFLNY